jgi:hypothetical protein
LKAFSASSTAALSVAGPADIGTYRSCPLRYKFARVLRIPTEQTIHQRDIYFSERIGHVLGGVPQT